MSRLQSFQPPAKDFAASDLGGDRSYSAGHISPAAPSTTSYDVTAGDYDNRYHPVISSDETGTDPLTQKPPDFPPPATTVNDEGGADHSAAVMRPSMVYDNVGVTQATVSVTTQPLGLEIADDRPSHDSVVDSTQDTDIDNDDSDVVVAFSGHHEYDRYDISEPEDDDGAEEEPLESTAAVHNNTAAWDSSTSTSR